MQAIKDRERWPVQLSEQQCVDCARGANGCNGGKPTDCWEMSKWNGGTMKNSDYRYRAIETGRCLADNEDATYRSFAENWGTVRPDSAIRMLQRGPLAIDVAAGSDFWRNYRGGVVTSSSDCPNRWWNLNHSVVIVGFEAGYTGWTKKEECNWTWRGRNCNEFWERITADVWLIQNSQGDHWGDDGFMRIKKEDNGNGGCGMNHRIRWLTVK